MNENLLVSNHQRTVDYMMTFETEERTRSVMKSLDSIKDVCSKLVSSVNDYRYYLESGELEPDLYGEYLIKSDSLNFKLIHGIEKIYQTLQIPRTADGLISYSEAEELLFEKSFIPAEGVGLSSDTDCIYLKVPMLIHRKKGFLTNSAGSSYYTDHTAFFKNTVEYVMRKKDFSAEFLDGFQLKTVNYFFVYPEGEIAIDSDNHDTKSVTDALTMYLPGGDSAETCTFCETTIFTNMLKKGTYIVVTKGKENYATSSQVLNKLITCFE